MKGQLIILSIIVSISSFAQNKKSLLRDGNTLYNDSNYTQAEIQYRKSLEKDQEYFNAHFNLADAIYKQGRYKESSAIFDALKNKAPNEEDLSKIYHNLGNSLVNEQKFDDAIDAYKDALRINPNDKETRHNLILTQKKQQENQERENQEKENQEQENQEQESQEQENQEQENQEQENQEQENQEQENQEEREKDEMTKEDAEKMLEAIQQEERKLQEELQRKKMKGKKIKVLKDW